MNLENEKISYIFVVQFGDGDIIAVRKTQIDKELDKAEERGDEIDFTTIGKIKEPPYGLDMDFNEKLIEFYKPEDVTQQMKEDAAKAIVKLLYYE
jgi:hypothetical protein